MRPSHRWLLTGRQQLPASVSRPPLVPPALCSAASLSKCRLPWTQGGPLSQSLSRSFMAPRLKPKVVLKVKAPRGLPGSPSRPPSCSAPLSCGGSLLSSDPVVAAVPSAPSGPPGQQCALGCARPPAPSAAALWQNEDLCQVRTANPRGCGHCQQGSWRTTTRTSPCVVRVQTQPPLTGRQRTGRQTHSSNEDAEAQKDSVALKVTTGTEWWDPSRAVCARARSANAHNMPDPDERVT